MKKFGCTALVAVLALSGSSAAFAQDQFVLTAPTWGDAQNQAVAAAGGTVTFSHGGAGVAVVRSSTANFLIRVRASKAITTADPDAVIQWQPDVADISVDDAAINPSNDTFFPIQWAPQAIQAPEAWALGCTGAGVRVAILDGGIYDGHPDLSGNIDVAKSRSFVPGQPFNADLGTFWHGTHVAGIVAAMDNDIGVVGIAPEATLIGVKVLHGGTGSFGGIINGILYAATPIAQNGAGADIINMSLGAVFARGGGNTGAGPLVAAMNKAVNYANRHGVLVVSATGNDGLDLDHSKSLIAVPAESGAGVAVSATAPIRWALGATNYATPTTYTNYGTSVVNVSAPGGDTAYPGNELCTLPAAGGTVTAPCWVFDAVLSTSRGTMPAGGYSWATGTSMAAPAASAVAAIIKQKNPNISLGALKTALQRTAVDAGKKGTDPFHGKGFVNALNACRQ
jgi:lantibiotic leader peptide-processing serine protease